MEKFVKDEIVPDVIRAAPTAKMTVKEKTRTSFQSDRLDTAEKYLVSTC